MSMTPEELVSVARAHATRLAGMAGWPEGLDSFHHARTRTAAIVEFVHDDGRSRLEVWIDSETGERIEIRHLPSAGPASHYHVTECR